MRTQQAARKKKAREMQAQATTTGKEGRKGLDRERAQMSNGPTICAHAYIVQCHSMRTRSASTYAHGMSSALSAPRLSATADALLVLLPPSAAWTPTRSAAPAAASCPTAISDAIGAAGAL